MLGTDNMTWSTYESAYSFAQVEATRDQISFTLYESTTLEVEENFDEPKPSKL